MGDDILAQLRAAAGDLDALRKCVDIASGQAFANDDPVAAIEAVTYARLAAASGDVSDQARLIVLLGQVGSMLGGALPQYRIALTAELLARVSLLADGGHDIADERFPALVEQASPEALEYSKLLRERFIQIEGHP